MLTITPNDNRETVHYPLASANSVYPDGLISDICIVLPNYEPDKDPEVYLDSVVCTPFYVHIMISGRLQDNIMPLGFGTSDMSTKGIVYIFSELSGECIGWVVLGSVSESRNTYSQRVRICNSCVHRAPIGFEYVINGVTYEAPESMNIIVAGDIEVSRTDSTIYLYNGYDMSSQEYDMDNLEEIGPITTINGIGPITTINGPVPEDRALHITLPEGSDVNKREINGTYVITIECINENFSCPDSDILLSIINTEDSGLESEETPLRSYIEAYKDSNTQSKV